MRFVNINIWFDGKAIMSRFCVKGLYILLWNFKGVKKPSLKPIMLTYDDKGLVVTSLKP